MDFVTTAGIGRAMTEPDLRAIFTEIGCIMEDASLIALLWQANDGLAPADRVAQLRKAHDRIGVLLDAIETNVR